MMSAKCHWLQLNATVTPNTLVVWWVRVGGGGVGLGKANTKKDLICNVWESNPGLTLSEGA